MNVETYSDASNIVDRIQRRSYGGYDNNIRLMSYESGLGFGFGRIATDSSITFPDESVAPFLTDRR